MAGLKRRKSEFSREISDTSQGGERNNSEDRLMWGGEGRGKSERGKIYRLGQ